MRFTMAALVVTVATLVGPSMTGAAPIHGPLYDHPDSLVQPSFSNSSPFNNGVGTSGWVDFVVLTAADFNDDFSGLGYVPTDAYVYAYQVFAFSVRPIIGLAMSVEVGSAHTIGSIKLVGGMDPTSAQFIDNGSTFLESFGFTGGEAQWFFAPGVEADQWSAGLVFSSPYLPVFRLVQALADYSDLPPGPYWANTHVPVPSGVPVPEPGSLMLVVVGGAVSGIRAWRLRRRTTEPHQPDPRWSRSAAAR